MTGTVLLTGAAGAIGRSLTPALANRYRLVGIDLRAPDGGFPGEFAVGDCADPALAERVVRGTDAVVHLAGIPTEAALPDILHSHVETTAALLDAMTRHGVARMVYASSNHAVGMTPRPPAGLTLSEQAPPRPDTFYGVGKVAAEALLSLYADRHGISSAAIRIGSFLPRPQTRRALATWLSPGDCARLFLAALTAEFTGVQVVYGTSANHDAWWSLDSARALGYEPVDDASDYESEIAARPEDDAEAERVGGPFTLADASRPPFDSR